VFSPKSQPVTLDLTGQTANFTGAPVTISGTVTFKGAAVTANLTMQKKGNGKTVYDSPDASGYTFGPVVNGTYQVTPVLTHDGPLPKSSPPSATIVINGKSVKQNFTYEYGPSCKKCH
jgi:hypothetical protein